MNTKGQVHSLILVQGQSDSTFYLFCLETADPIAAKFHLCTLWEGGTKDCSNGSGMAAMSMYDNNP